MLNLLPVLASTWYVRHHCGLKQHISTMLKRHLYRAMLIFWWYFMSISKLLGPDSVGDYVLCLWCECFSSDNKEIKCKSLYVTSNCFETHIEELILLLRTDMYPSPIVLNLYPGATTTKMNMMKIFFILWVCVISFQFTSFIYTLIVEMFHYGMKWGSR